MKVLLVKPPFTDLSFVKYFAVCEPLELEMLAASIQNLCEVEIIDLRFEKKGLVDKLEKYKPDIVGFTSLTFEANSVLALSKKVKEYLPNTLVCVGGEHATLMPETFSNCSTIDLVFKYDALITFPELIKQLKSANLNQLNFSNDKLISNLKINDDIHSFPLPMRELCSKYLKHYTFGCANPISLVQMSSGCSYNCSFCSIPARFKKFSPVSIDRVLKDLESTKTKDILTIDANSLNNINQAELLFKEIAKANLNKRIMISCRSDSIVRHPEILNVLAKAKVSVIAMGLETNSDEKLQKYEKINSADNNIKAVQLIHSHGIMVRGNFVIDQSFTKYDFESLASMVEKYEIEFPTYQILTPLPGTPFYEEVKDKIITTNLDYFDLSHSVLETSLPFVEFHKEFQNLFKRSYGVKRLLWLTKKLPLMISIKGMKIALKSHLEFSYNKHNNEINYSA